MITDKSWKEFRLPELEAVPDARGIFEFADECMVTIYIGSTGSEGLRACLTRYRKERPDPCIAASAYYFRYEETDNNAAWHARMLEAYRAAHNGHQAPCNREPVQRDEAAR